MTWKVFARYHDFANSVEIAAAYTSPTGKRAFIKPPFTMQDYEQGALINPEDVDLARGIDGRAFLQAMLDAAWELGLRPKGFEDHTNELIAVRYHLEDMRTLAKAK